MTLKADGPVRYNPVVTQGFTDQYTLNMEAAEDGRWVRWSDHQAELGIEKQVLAEELMIQHYTECRDMFIVGSVSWEAINDMLEALKRPEA